MTVNQEFNRLVRRTSFLSVAFVAGLAFGIVLVTSGDWIPGGIIVAAALVGLAVQVPVIRKLCSEGPAPSPPSGTPSYPHRRHQPPTPRA